MVVAFYLVALAMVAGGLAAIYFGSDIIMVERGWTMVIAGTVAAASGALLAGLAAVVAQLRALQTEFGRVRERLGRLDGSFPPPPGLPELARAAASAPMPETPRREQMGAAPPIGGVVREDALGPFGLGPERKPPAPAERPATPAPGEAPRPAPHGAAVEAHGGRTATVEQRSAAAALAGGGEAEAPSVVGTYSSGGNFYIMYSDGSIEAETPAGKFRFGSLDELKEFIAAGGDRPKASNTA